LLVKEFHKTKQNNEKLIAKYAEPLYMKEPNPLGPAFLAMWRIILNHVKINPIGTSDKDMHLRAF
jgi:hypothetical protein